MAYENKITTLPDHSRSPKGLSSLLKDRWEKGGTNHVVSEIEGKI